MIKFRNKTFSEYDAMRSLYVEIMKLTHNDRNQYPTIDSSSLIAVLKGNNIVVEKFVVSTRLFGHDKYRMYLKIGARAKMPDQVRLTGRIYDKRLGSVSLNLNNSIQRPQKNGQFWNYEDYDEEDWDRQVRQSDYRSDRPLFQDNYRRKVVYDGPKLEKKVKFESTRTEDGRLKLFSDLRQKEFKGGGNNGGAPYASGGFKANDINISYEVQTLLGDAIKFDKKSRLLVLEFDTISDAIRALNILPFGLGYKIYFLDV